MSSKIKKVTVRQVLEDTGFAYGLSCETEHLNTDYAGYASAQALRAFQRAFHNPELTHAELCVLLRKASSKADIRQCKTPWSMFMANYINKHCNAKEITYRG